MQHPLANPSLTPYGFVFPLYRNRLDYDPKLESWVNPEKIIARFWDRANRLNAPKPRPTETIIHKILPGMAAANRNFAKDFVFDDLPYASRDIVVLSSVVQWLATNIGRCFLETDMRVKRHRRYHPEREFLIKFEQEQAQERKDMVVYWTHICTSRCNKVLTSFAYDPHCYDPSTVSARDRAVVEGLLRWLGQKDGRAFIADYIARRKRVQDAAEQRAEAQRLAIRSRRQIA